MNGAIGVRDIDGEAARVAVRSLGWRSIKSEVGGQRSEDP